MPVILRNNATNIEIDINPNLKYTWMRDKHKALDFNLLLCNLCNFSII
jgi:hypothetical protein